MTAEKVDNHWNGYTTVAISPNGKIAAAANRFVVVLFDIEQGRQVGWFWAYDDKGKSFRLPRMGLGDTLSFIDENHIVTTGMGGSSFSFFSRAPGVIMSAMGQPAFFFGKSTVLSGHKIEAVSAMK